MKLKTALMLMIVAATGAAGKAQPAASPNQPDMSTAIDFPDVSRGHWAYVVITTLAQTGVIEGDFSEPSAARYEFAVALARMLEAASKSPGIAESPTADEAVRRYIASKAKSLPPYVSSDALAEAVIAACREFSPEIGHLGRRDMDDMRPLTWEAIISYRFLIPKPSAAMLRQMARTARWRELMPRLQRPGYSLPVQPPQPRSDE